jgi:hypothetical protein
MVCRTSKPQTEDGTVYKRRYECECGFVGAAVRRIDEAWDNKTADKIEALAGIAH